ncbi:hypothetical protein J6590_021593 [Homalodisca vitripennis]|nr:hypothetical protein J6590_021593 [Homalodisca vitripennis]
MGRCRHETSLVILHRYSPVFCYYPLTPPVTFDGVHYNCSSVHSAVDIKSNTRGRSIPDARRIRKKE